MYIFTYIYIYRVIDANKQFDSTSYMCSLYTLSIKSDLWSHLATLYATKAFRKNVHVDAKSALSFLVSQTVTPHNTR